MPAYKVIFRIRFPANTKWWKGKQLEPGSGDKRQSLIPVKVEARLETPVQNCVLNERGK